jgi:S-adenosylmethionine synthetase
VKDIGYQQRGFRWEKASIKVYLHGQSVDIAQDVVSTASIQSIDLAHYGGAEVWHANPKGAWAVERHRVCRRAKQVRKRLA